MKTKKCSQCNRRKSLDKYSPDARHTDGKCSRCKTCSAAYTKQYLLDHPDKRWTPKGNIEGYDSMRAFWQAKSDKIRQMAIDRGCEACGTHDSLDGPFDWHHHDKSEKELQMSNSRSCSWERLMKEANKPSVHVLCHRCHGQVEAILGGKKLRNPAPHIEAFIDQYMYQLG